MIELKTEQELNLGNLKSGEIYHVTGQDKVYLRTDLIENTDKVYVFNISEVGSGVFPGTIQKDGESLVLASFDNNTAVYTNNKTKYESATDVPVATITFNVGISSVKYEEYESAPDTISYQGMTLYYVGMKSGKKVFAKNSDKDRYGKNDLSDEEKETYYIISVDGESYYFWLISEDRGI